jgi:hypothetical protein
MSDYAVHGPDSNGSYWVTHSPTGKRVASFNSQYQAKQYIAGREEGSKQHTGPGKDRTTGHWWFR